jgi:hypothetical protein
MKTANREQQDWPVDGNLAEARHVGVSEGHEQTQGCKVESRCPARRHPHRTKADGWHAPGRQSVLGDPEGNEYLRLALTRDTGSLPNPQTNLLECAALLTSREISRRRGIPLLHIDAGRRMPNAHQPIRIGISERPQQQGVNDAEERGVSFATSYSSFPTLLKSNT